MTITFNHRGMGVYMMLTFFFIARADGIFSTGPLTTEILNVSVPNVLRNVFTSVGTISRLVFASHISREKVISGLLDWLSRTTNEAFDSLAPPQSEYK